MECCVRYGGRRRGAFHASVASRYVLVQTLLKLELLSIHLKELAQSIIPLPFWPFVLSLAPITIMGSCTATDGNIL